MNTPSITLLELQGNIKEAISNGLDISYWVVAEINEIKVNSNGHCYLELIHKDANDNFIKAKISANIWSYTYSILKSYFEKVTQRQLESGIKVLVKGQVNYHELYGMNFNITDINPTYTVGDIEAQRTIIIEQLKSDGVFNLNKELDFPTLPQNIAIISSEQAAGYQDFYKHLLHNKYGFNYNLTLFPSIMQGKTAESSIISSLNAIYNKLEEFDIVVIIRGGGSQTDLACFNSYDLAYNLAQFPLPCLTGIGHDKDESITDLVAYKALKTPTAVADYLVSMFLSISEYLDNSKAFIEQFAVSYINNEQNILQNLSTNIKYAYNAVFVKEKALLDTWLPQKLKQSAKQFIKNQKTKVDKCNSHLYLINPKNILSKGYSVTLKNGKILKSATDVKENDVIETVFEKGRITSVVSNTKKK